MADVIVTVPKRLWEDWIGEGDAAGVPPTGGEWVFWTWGSEPQIKPGERVYIVAHGKLRGYAPLTRLVFEGPQAGLGRIGFVRRAEAVAVTIATPIRGFRGFRYRWWDRNDEIPFAEWRTP